MSRQRINSHASGYSLHQSGFESPPAYHSSSRRSRLVTEETEFVEEQRRLEAQRQRELDYQDEKRRQSRLEETYHDDVSQYSSRTSYARVTYKTDGMVLRSGSRLSGVGEYLERNNNRASSTTSQTSSQSLVRSLNSEFEEVDSSQMMQHSTPLSHLYDKNVEQRGDTSLNARNLSVSGIFSPQRTVRTVVTTETIEYIDSQGRRRTRPVEPDVQSRVAEDQANAAGDVQSPWFSGIRNVLNRSQTDTTVTEQSEIAAETEEPKESDTNGWFGMFKRSEVSTEERLTEEEQPEPVQTDDRRSWLGAFRRSETEEEKEVEAEPSESVQKDKQWLGLFRSATESETSDARKQGLAEESDAEEEVEHPGWRNSFKNLISRSMVEKWQTESVKENKDAIEDTGNSGWFGWLRTKTEYESSNANGNSENKPGWFNWYRSSETDETDANGNEPEAKSRWFGWYRSSNTDTSETVKENHSSEANTPKAGWFGWSSTTDENLGPSAKNTENVNGDSKSRLFSWLGMSSEQKISDDMNETESDTGKSGWFGWWKTSDDKHTEGTDSARNVRRRSKGRRVKFSLDSDDDGEVSKSATSTSRSSYTSRSSESLYGRSRTWMQLLLTTITTLSSFFTGLFRPLTDSYAYRQTKLVIWRQLRIADMWVVSRRLGGCCLCLPLLLLLPLLLGYLYGGDLLEQARASVKSYTILAATTNDTHTRPLPYVDPSTINIKIQQFFDEHKHRYELSQLSEDDVRRIAQGLIASQLGDLKLALLQDINQMKGDQIASKTSQQNSMTGLEQKLGDFIAKYQSLENDMAALRTAGKEDLAGVKQDYQAQILGLEQQMKSLGEDLSNLQISHLELLASVRNCCRNDSFYAMAVRKHVQDIFAEMMAGGGGADKDEGYSAFLAWLQANYARKDDMDREMVKVSEDITQRILAITKEQASSIYIQSNTEQGPSLSEDYIRWIVDDALQKFSADQVGMADYALESAGGSVLSVRCSETYYKKTALVSVFGIPLWYTTNSPRTVIQPDVHPGQCWAFKGARGFLVVQLAFPVKPTGFTLEHIPKALSPTGNIDSAPKNFAVYGLTSESDKVGMSLGNYTYADSGKAIQYFPLQATTGDFFEFVELKVLSNHGNPEYTCLYRFRVHGMPYKPT